MDNKIFFLVQDYYSNPEVIIAVAESVEEAVSMWPDEHEWSAHSRVIKHVQLDKFHEIDLTVKDFFILRPPGNRDLR